jgi:recombination protein RecT
MNSTAVAVLAKSLEDNKTKLVKHLPYGADKEHSFNMLMKVTALMPDNINPLSLRMAAYDCFSLGLDPDPAKGYAYFVPFKGAVQLIIGYKGLMELVRRAGVTVYNVDVVYDCDDFEYEEGTTPVLRHRKNMARDKSAKLVGAYVKGSTPDKQLVFSVMTKQDVEDIKAGTRGSAIWQKHEAEMWKKTALRRFCKYMVRNDSLEKAVRIDELADARTKVTRNLNEYEEVAQDVSYENVDSGLSQDEKGYAEQIEACTTIEQLQKVSESIPQEAKTPELKTLFNKKHKDLKTK